MTIGVRVKVKICGITNLEDAQAAVNAGCDALGFVFYKRSRRYIAPPKAAEIIRQLPKNTLKIGVFVDGREGGIKDIARVCKLDILQFHGDESSAFCRKFKGYKVIKAFRIKGRLDLKNVLEYDVFGYLFDTFRKDRFGGTGKSFNWSLLSGLGRLRGEIFLSGGLTAGNIRKAVAAVKPDWVDVSSSVEKAVGRKDHLKVRKFIRAAKE